MTTSLDPSVDEMLLLQENQYRMSNVTLANIKPIGAERKILGQPTRTSSHRHGHSMSITRDIYETNNHRSFAEIPSSISTLDYLHYSTNDKATVQQRTKEFKSRPFDEQSSRLLPYTNSYNFQRLTEKSANSTVSTRITPTKTILSFSTPQSHSAGRFVHPHNYGNPFSSRCQPTRSFLPVFATPLQCTRERFQVNSIGRPILRTNNYNHSSSSAHVSQVRR